MYDTLMERHLLKMIEPYNRVQIAYLAGLLKLDEHRVEARISQLILDGKLAGIVDQQHRCLVLFDEVESARTRKNVLHDASSTVTTTTNTSISNNGMSNYASPLTSHRVQTDVGGKVQTEAQRRIA
uniref:26S proteasome non-ATPase regulatory subunit 11 n=1 Tax=Lygus hesperus TaxID=30085 RepID=A0A0A9W4I1_LYGHE